MVHLRFFGAPELRRDGALLSGVMAQRHRLALLTLTAIAAPRAIARDRVMSLLWPESDADRARHRLNVAVHALRRALGSDLLVSHGDELRLDLALARCDVTEFETAIDAGDHAWGVGLYSGPFLDGFFLRGAPEFERWVDGERTRLAHRYADALQRLARCAEARRDVAGAIVWWRRAVEHDPLATSTTIGLMRALDRAGDRAAALRLAEVHARLLREEIGAEPHDDLRCIIERLRCGSLAPGSIEPSGGESPSARTSSSAVDSTTATKGAESTITAKPPDTDASSALRESGAATATVASVAAAVAIAAEHQGAVDPIAGIRATGPSPQSDPDVTGSSPPMPRRSSAWPSWMHGQTGQRHRALASRGVVAALLAVAGYSASRALGLGPAASLLSSGVLAPGGSVLISEFAGMDTAVASVATEAFRTDFAQSRAFAMPSPEAIRTALQRMRRPEKTPISGDVARELAVREGIKVVVEGEVRTVGGAYLLMVRLVDPSTGTPLRAFRATAATPSAILGAIDQLSKQARAGIGESPKRVRASPSL